MTYKTGTAVGHEALLEDFRKWILGHGTATTPDGTGNTGNGTCSAVTCSETTVTETWTVACTDDSGSGNETWSVTGSVSGLQAATATTGVAYESDSGEVAFTIADGGTDYVVGDEWTFGTTIGAMTDDGYAWEQLKYDTSTTNETHLYLKGFGNGGTDEIFVNLRTYKNVGTGYYNIELRGATGFVTGNARTAQPGISPLADLCLWQNSMDYWFIANGRRFIIIAKVSTVYESAYAGFILPTGLPSEYPYPLVIGACNGTTAQLYSSTAAAHAAFFAPDNSMHLLGKAGTWLTFDNPTSSSGANYRTHPWFPSLSLDTTPTAGIYPCLNAGVIDASSDYALFQGGLIGRVSSPAATDIFGELEGVFHVSGHNNAAENIVTVDAVDHLVIQNAHRTGKDDYAAFKLG